MLNKILNCVLLYLVSRSEHFKCETWIIVWRSIYWSIGSNARNIKLETFTFKAVNLQQIQISITIVFQTDVYSILWYTQVVKAFFFFFDTRGMWMGGGFAFCSRIKLKTPKGNKVALHLRKCSISSQRTRKIKWKLYYTQSAPTFFFQNVSDLI